MDILNCPSPINLKRKSEEVPSLDESKRSKHDLPSPKPEDVESINNNYKTLDEECLGECEDAGDDSYGSDSEVTGAEVKDVSGTEVADLRGEFQQWLLKAYGDLKKTKTITLKKYDRIVRTLRGLIPTVAENSKFRFWIRSKGFCLGHPDSSGDQELLVTSLKVCQVFAQKPEHAPCTCRLVKDSQGHAELPPKELFKS